MAIESEVKNATEHQTSQFMEAPSTFCTNVSTIGGVPGVVRLIFSDIMNTKNGDVELHVRSSVTVSLGTALALVELLQDCIAKQTTSANTPKPMKS